MSNFISSFDRALQFVLGVEGGWSDHPADRGGQTNHGITQATYDEYRRLLRRPTRSVREINGSEVREAYHLLFWIPAKCSSMRDALALVHFDWAVNCGVSGAFRTLQQAIGVTVDGIWGNKSQAALEDYLRRHGEQTLIAVYLELREQYYRHQALKFPSQQAFLAGWLNRIAALRQKVGMEK